PHFNAFGTAERRKARRRGAGEFCGLAQRKPLVYRYGGVSCVQLRVLLHSWRTERGIGFSDGQYSRAIESLITVTHGAWCEQKFPPAPRSVSYAQGCPPSIPP